MSDKKRMDESPKKRVELHLHTKYSQGDSVVGVAEAIKRAREWGMNALAITDYAVVQAFPHTQYALMDYPDFKVIYGVEGYFVNDLEPIVMNSHGETFDDGQEYVVFDIETTGLSMKHCKIIEIGAVRVDAAGREIGRFSEYINPGEPISDYITMLTSISDDTVKNCPDIDDILPRFLEFAKGAVLVAHNATFDAGFIRENCERLGLLFQITVIDTMTLSYVLLPQLERYSLDRITQYFGIVKPPSHRACDDADITLSFFMELLRMVREKGIHTVDELISLGRGSADFVRKSCVFHGTILVKNEIGRTNLYRLISDSHIKFFHRLPRIPLSQVEKCREGLLLGTACGNGQLYRALLDGRSDQEIERIVSFYDYLEIQPASNNRYLIEDGMVAAVQSEKDLQDLNKRIISLGKKYGKPVVATGDVHFLDPEDAAYRTIIQEGTKTKAWMKDEPLIPIEEGETPLSNEMLRQPPLYFHTTEEMLEEFAYLGSELAEEVVIDNTNLIADMIERISPVRPDRCLPIIENSDDMLRETCEKRAHEIYGKKLPDTVLDRLNTELDAIIGHGYSSIYNIAQGIVRKSHEEGYPIFPRYTASSSLVAYLSGVSEINPLPAHYICPECHFTDFPPRESRSMFGMSGCDLPNRICPRCGHKLMKEGHDIPWETFMGLDGDKEPNLIFNICSDYQKEAEEYLRESLGTDCVFRSGTVASFGEKTVHGYIKRFCQRRGITMDEEKVDYITSKCLGVKRSTGLISGKLVLVPQNEEISSFTPIQKPADDMTVDYSTTHFELSAYDHNLLSFELLEHGDLEVLRLLEKMTGVDIKDIPLDDQKVMSLFRGRKALGFHRESGPGRRLGCLGISEYADNLAMQILLATNPQSFSDLIRIYGLYNGEDTWFKNARELINFGARGLESVICSRDDILIYLMNMGLEREDAFWIMEFVRKGWPIRNKNDIHGSYYERWNELKGKMNEHSVSELFVMSCEKIRYLMPKAHCVNYALMSWRMAYFKLYYPLEFYAAYFSIYGHAISYEEDCQGEERLNKGLSDLLEKDDWTDRDNDRYKVMRILQEMYARGVGFMAIDIYQADDTYFRVVDGKLMPSLRSIEGMGVLMAAELKEEAKKGPFKSQKDLMSRVWPLKSLVRHMAELGILGDLPEMG